MFKQLIRRLVDRAHAPRVGFLHEPTAIATTIDPHRPFAEVSLDEYVATLERAGGDGVSGTAIIPFTDGRFLLVGATRDDSQVHTIMLGSRRELGEAMARVVRTPGTNLIIERPWWRTGAGIIKPPPPPPPPPTQRWIQRAVLPILDATIRIIDLDQVEVSAPVDDAIG